MGTVGARTTRSSGQEGSALGKVGAGGSGAATGCHDPPQKSERTTGSLVPSTVTIPRWKPVTGSSGVEVIRATARRVPSGDQSGAVRASVRERVELALVAAVGVDDPGADRARAVVEPLGWVHDAMEGKPRPVRRPLRRVRSLGEQALTGPVGLHDVDVTLPGKNPVIDLGDGQLGPIRRPRW